jgi:hypothetical protein
MPCPVCEISFESETCPQCDPGLVEKFLAMEPGSYPAIAMPPAHGLNAGRAADLRRAILSNDVNLADHTWLVILRGLHGSSAQERALHADCWDAYGFFLDHAGRSDEGRRAHQRAATARKDPSDLKRKQEAGTESSSAAALRRVYSDDFYHPDAEAVQRVQAELDRQLAAQARREKILKVGGLSFAGLVGGAVIGIPAAVTGALGAGLGWAWSRHTA